MGVLVFFVKSQWRLCEAGAWKKAGNKSSSQKRSQWMAAMKRWTGKERGRKSCSIPQEVQVLTFPFCCSSDLGRTSLEKDGFKKKRNPNEIQLSLTYVRAPVTCTIVPGRTPKKDHFVNHPAALGRSTIVLCLSSPPLTPLWNCWSKPL